MGKSSIGWNPISQRGLHGICNHTDFLGAETWKKKMEGGRAKGTYRTQVDLAKKKERLQINVY